ncbi:protein kinase domain-containing protein [Citricoccus nitrophenolicus]|uniref:protein kinase domain-containing protein n=1 Tax=Citricoccus nitrophenolicus TaxID=863575 RepID=UPI0039B5EEF9
MTYGLDRYEVQEVIGVGSFATAHRAHDGLLEGTVVLKILAENHSLNPEVRERFIAEGRSLRKVAGPHVVAVHDIGESDRNQPYLVLEYADRGTLADRVGQLRARGWRAGPQDVLAVARPMTAALETVHRAQLVHRDLSPGNLLLTGQVPSAPTGSANREAGRGPGGNSSDAEVVRPDERLLVADLGMCKDLALNSGLTVAGGTSGFRPPEQSGPGVVDTRADIWAASALLAWLAQDADLPRAFLQVLRRGMRTSPRQRQQTMAEWGAEIERALAPDTTRSTTPAPPSSGTGAPEVPAGPGAGRSARGAAGGERRPRWRVRAVGLVALLATLAALTGVVAGYLWGSPDAPPTAEAGASISVHGPEAVAVGQEITLSADVEGLDSWVWTLPTGAQVIGEREVTMTATRPGTSEVILRARVPGGPELEARYEVTVTE